MSKNIFNINTRHIILYVILSVILFVGGISYIILDNFIPLISLFIYSLSILVTFVLITIAIISIVWDLISLGLNLFGLASPLELYRTIKAKISLWFEAEKKPSKHYYFELKRDYVVLLWFFCVMVYPQYCIYINMDLGMESIYTENTLFILGSLGVYITFFQIFWNLIWNNCNNSTIFITIYKCIKKKDYKSLLFYIIIYLGFIFINMFILGFILAWAGVSNEKYLFYIYVRLGLLPYYLLMWNYVFFFVNKIFGSKNKFSDVYYNTSKSLNIVTVCAVILGITINYEFRLLLFNGPNLWENFKLNLNLIFSEIFKPNINLLDEQDIDSLDRNSQLSKHDKESSKEALARIMNAGVDINEMITFFKDYPNLSFDFRQIVPLLIEKEVHDGVFVVAQNGKPFAYSKFVYHERPVQTYYKERSSIKIPGNELEVLQAKPVPTSVMHFFNGTQVEMKAATVDRGPNTQVKYFNDFDFKTVKPFVKNKDKDLELFIYDKKLFLNTRRRIIIV